MPRLRPYLLLLATLLAGCSPKTLPAGAPVMAPHVADGALVARDGARLPVRRWTATSPAKGAIIALHGYTDYSAAFEQLGPWLAGQGYDVLAYDQRGFGEAPHPGIWAGTESLTADLEDAILVVRQEHPELPLYVLGESMGGSVAMVAAARMAGPPDGLILAAPGVRDELPWRGFWDVAIWLGAHAAPGYTVDVDRNGPSPLTPGFGAAPARRPAGDPPHPRRQLPGSDPARRPRQRRRRHDRGAGPDAVRRRGRPGAESLDRRRDPGDPGSENPAGLSGRAAPSAALAAARRGMAGPAAMAGRG